jgi:dephospho-CoA kinase
VAIRVFGLTGGIGTGKSTVARRFAERGLPVIDADQLARKVVEPGSAGLAAVVAAFGADVLDAAGALDRKRLGRRVFGDEQRRQELAALLHPLIRQRFQQRVGELDARGEPLACYDVPLLFEVGLDASLRPVVVVTAPLEEQVRRVMARDGLDRAAAAARIATQLPLSEKRARADHVIDNARDQAHTLAQADRVLDAIARDAGVDPSRYPP